MGRIALLTSSQKPRSANIRQTVRSSGCPETKGNGVLSTGTKIKFSYSAVLSCVGATAPPTTGGTEVIFGKQRQASLPVPMPWSEAVDLLFLSCL